METTYTIPMLVKWRCTKCGQLVQANSVTVVKNSGKTIKWEENGVSAKNDEVAKVLQKIDEESEKRMYETAGLNCKCPNCGRREAWARLRFLPVDMIFVSLFVMSLFLLFVYPVGEIMISVPVVFFISRAIYHAVMRKKIREMSPESLPDMYCIRKETEEDA